VESGQGEKYLGWNIEVPLGRENQSFIDGEKSTRGKEYGNSSIPVPESLCKSAWQRTGKMANKSMMCERRFKLRERSGGPRFPQNGSLKKVKSCRGRERNVVQSHKNRTFAVAGGRGREKSPSELK